jgi:SnoaL-like domain
MSQESVVKDLFDRWASVWHEGRYDLVARCVAPVYLRHDESGTREVKPEGYSAELAAARRERPDTRIIVYDHAFEANSAWFRFTLRWTDQGTGEVRTRAGMQQYRIEAGKLAETFGHAAQTGLDLAGRRGAGDLDEQATLTER